MKASDIIDFLVITVGLKFIIGHWIAERLETLIKRWFHQTDRKQAIWEHYKSRAEGRGHQNDNVLTCGQERCGVFSC